MYIMLEILVAAITFYIMMYHYGAARKLLVSLKYDKRKHIYNN